MRTKIFGNLIAAITLLIMAAPCAAQVDQTTVDQADPSIVEQELRQEQRGAPRAKPSVVIAPEAERSSAATLVTAGAIRVEGARVLPAGAFAAVVQSYVGRILSPDDLRALASDVANVARDAGFGLATAWIPEQRVANGVLRVALDEGTISEIEIDGGAGAAVRPYLTPLTSGGPVPTAELERRLMLAADVPGVRLGKARLDRRSGRNVLVLKAYRDQVQGRAFIDNWGSSAVGPVRARLSVDFNGLLTDDDRLTIAGVVTPLEPKEFGLLRAAYSKQIGTEGTELTLGGYFANSEPGGVLAGRDVKGRSLGVEAGLSHPFVRARSASLWGGLHLSVRDSSQSRRGVKVRDDRLSTLTASTFATRQLEGGRIRARIAAVQGLALFDATRPNDPLASRRDADGTFSKLEAWGDYEQRLGLGFSFLMQAEGQVAAGPLLASEEMGLGGRSFGRAWDYREFSGDKGVAASVELRFDVEGMPRPLTGAQLYGYADAGSVANYRGGFGGGSLVSAGGGLRLWLGRAEAGIELGLPLSDGADPLAGQDPRISFTVGSRF